MTRALTIAALVLLAGCATLEETVGEIEPPPGEAARKDPKGFGGNRPWIPPP